MGDVFPFVVGCGRSGTTMLRAMLDSHPLVAVPHESYFVTPALRRRAGYEAGAGFDRSRLLDDLGQDDTFTRWQLDAELVRAVRGDEGLRTVPEVLAALYRAFATQAGKSRYADKTPRNVLHIDLIGRNIADARFVHLVRDGRDVVPSMMGLPYFPDGFADAVMYWSDRVKTGRRAGRALGPDRYLEVRYEELVAAPEPTLQALCGFLDLTFDEAMLRYYERADEVTVAVTEVGHHQGLWQPPTPGIRSWRATMPPHDQQVFEALAGPTLDEFGYERSGLPPSRSARREARAWRTRTGLARRTGGLRAKAKGVWGSVSR